MKTQPFRIPNTQIDDCQTWAIPEIDGDKVLPSAEKELRERRAKEQRAKNEVHGEEVEVDEFSGPITAADLEKITEQARQEGYSQGFEQGHSEGLKKGSETGEKKAYGECQEKLNEHLTYLSELINGLSDPFEKETHTLQQMVLTTVVSLTQALVQRELATKPLAIDQLINSALQALPNTLQSNIDNHIHVHLHPEDIAMLQEYCPEKVNKWSLTPDGDIQRGGVIVKHANGMVNYSLESRLASVTKKFLSGELQENQPDEKCESETTQAETTLPESKEAQTDTAASNNDTLNDSSSVNPTPSQNQTSGEGSEDRE